MGLRSSLRFMQTLGHEPPGMPTAQEALKYRRPVLGEGGGGQWATVPEHSVTEISALLTDYYSN